MKIIKRIFYTICIMVMLGCAGILYCALNPQVTEKLAAALEENTEDITAAGVLYNDDADTDGTALEDSGADGTNQQAADKSGEADTQAYQTPEDSNVTAPDEVDGKNGYEPIKDVSEQIADTEAQSLKEELDTGELGSSLDFDEEKYPYYAMLEDNLKKLYKQIYANASETIVSFAPVEEVNTTELKTAFEAFFNDHPEIFWIQTGYSCKYTQDGQCVEIILKYYPIVNNLEAAENDFEAQAQNIINGASELETDYDKEKYVHDALITKVDYDASADMNQSAYSALVNGSSVCAGYARAFQYIMQQMEIPTYYCTGYSGEEHAWNIIKLGEEYYNVDVTWDDTEPSTYNYFNKTDADYAQTHVRKNLSVYLPACNGTEYTAEEGEEPENVEIPQDAVVDKTVQPLTWDSESTKESEEDTASEALKRAGVEQSEVIDTLEDYYNDCYTQLVNLGSGDRQFINVVTEVEWIVIEQEYSTGRYEDGYVKAALEELGMERFAIQIEAENLGDGYYRLYHNVVTWRD
ncbi:MAG: hypothetical protein LUG83_08410 [Lachnospiraceae bacterium]|nr:hypothetical protein [Lachnospiraceae bacterium]